MWLIPTAEAQTFMPPAASEVAGGVDSIYAFLLVASLISFVILIGGLMWFVWKYRRKTDNDKTAYITHNHALEFLWSFIPFVIFMVCFGWGTKVYLEMRTFHEDAMEVHVYGKKWAWEFIYKNGQKITGGVDDEGKEIPATLVVPINKPVKLIMTSVKVNEQDAMDKAVLHSFYVPAFRVKQDVVPGRYTALSFIPNKLGTFHVFCTEYCGTGHSNMLAAIKVVPSLEFDNFILGETGGGGSGEVTLADKGKKVYSTRLCYTCHSLDGSVKVGPSWKGLYGSKREFIDGSSAEADENYIRESIMNPNAKIVKGFQPNQMPSYQGQLSDEDIAAVIEFMKKFK